MKAVCTDKTDAFHLRKVCRAPGTWNADDDDIPSRIYGLLDQRIRAKLLPNWATTLSFQSRITL